MFDDTFSLVTPPCSPARRLLVCISPLLDTPNTRVILLSHFRCCCCQIRQCCCSGQLSTNIDLLVLKQRILQVGIACRRLSPKTEPAFKTSDADKINLPNILQMDLWIPRCTTVEAGHGEHAWSPAVLYVPWCGEKKPSKVCPRFFCLECSLPLDTTNKAASHLSIYLFFQKVVRCEQWACGSVLT